MQRDSASSVQNVIAQTVAVATSRVASAPNPQESNNAYANTINGMSTSSPIAFASMKSTLSDLERLRIQSLIAEPVECTQESIAKAGSRLKHRAVSIPLGFFSGKRDDAASLQTSSVGNGIMTHHTYQHSALLACGARDEPTEKKGSGAKGTVNQSRTAIAWKFGSAGDQEPTKISRANMTATDKKLIQGTLTGAGAAAEEYDVQPAHAKRRKMVCIDSDNIKRVFGFTETGRGFSQVTSLPPAVSSSQSQLVSAHDPLTGLAHTVIRLDTDLFTSVANNASNVKTSNHATTEAIEKAGAMHADHVTSDDFMDVDMTIAANEAQAIANLPKGETRKRRHRKTVAVQNDDLPAYLPDLVVEGTTKVTTDTTILQDPTIASKMQEAIRLKNLVQMQPEDNSVLFEPLKNSSGPSGLIAYVPSKTNMETVGASMSMIATVLRHNWFLGVGDSSEAVDKATEKLTGISIQDAKYCAEKRHPEIPLVQFPKLMNQRMRKLFENDVLFKALGLEKEIEDGLRKAGIDGHIGCETDSIQYIMLDIGMKGTDEKQDNIQKLAAAAQRGAVFAAFEEQQRRLEEKGFDHYGSKKKWRTSEQINASKREAATKYPEIEVVTMAHIVKYCTEHTLVDLDKTGKRLCKNGASCWCKMIAATRYARLFNGPPSFPKATDADRAAAGNIPMNVSTKISLDEHRYYGTAAQYFNKPQSMANLNAIAESHAQTRANLGFVGVEFLTPTQEKLLADWWEVYGDAQELAPLNDPRKDFNQLCFLCEMHRVTSEHVMHVNQRVPDQMQNIDAQTRDFLPINRFQVLHSLPGEYDKDALIETSIGAGVSGSTRLPSGRSLVVGPFPEFRLCNFELATIYIPNADGVECPRRMIRQPGMDFRSSLAM